jgi:hypothetical protein
MLAEIRAELEKEELLTKMTCVGLLSTEALMKALRRALPSQSESTFLRLERMLRVDAKGVIAALPASCRRLSRALRAQAPIVNYKSLFDEDREGNTSKLCEFLREQHQTEILRFSQHLIGCLMQVHVHFAAGIAVT